MFALLLTAAAAALAAPPPSAPAAAGAQSRADTPAAERIVRIEQDWGQAFVRRDFAFIEGIVAPEFRLAGVSPDGRESVTGRDEWMRNARAFEHQAFATEVVDVTMAGDTAVALVQGLWTVKRRPDRPAETVRFVATDTWVRRNGRWLVVYRYSHRLSGAAWPPPGAASRPLRPPPAVPPGAEDGSPRRIAAPPPYYYKVLLPERVASYVTPDDYPASAIRNREQGSTTFRVTVGVDGRVTGCAVTVSSGSAALDSTTCRMMQRRLRFRPALDASGQAVEDSYEGTVHWRLP